MAPIQITPENINKVDKIFYICSYTGCGTMILRVALQQMGYHSKIVHDRNPPKKLEFVSNDFVESGNERPDNVFNFNGIKVPDEYKHKIHVIYIFKNPINSIYSRLQKENMTRHIFNNTKNVKFEDVIEQKKDLYELENFFDNYTNPKEERDYKITCINYHKLFDNQNEISKHLGVGQLNLIKKEREHEQKNYDILSEIYSYLNSKIEKSPAFFDV